MHETDIHDLSDDADYAAASQQGSSSINRSDTSKRSSSSDLEDAEIVYMKDNVAIHPTQSAIEGIGGRLKLLKQGSSLFMTWIPYKGQSSNARLSARDANLYTIRAVSFSGIHSIRRHTPTIGWQYVIVVLSTGLAYPPLYFYSGGVREFFATIKQHVLIVRSSENANVFLVNNFQDPLQRTLSSLELPRSLANRTPSSSFPDSPSEGNSDNKHTSEDDSSDSIQQYNKQRQKSQDPARDISIQVLEKFSLVTRFARETTSQLFRESLDAHGPNEKRRTNWETSANDVEIAPKKVPVPSDPLELDKLSKVWGQPRQHPLEHQEWSIFLDSEGRIVDPDALRMRVFYGGVEDNLRKEVWPFLLGYYSYDSTYAEREYAVSAKKSEYETIKNQWQSISVEQAKRFTKFRERNVLIEKDVVRTDRSLSFYEGDDNPDVRRMHDILLTYSFYNFDLGYCQGMSDLLSPILYIMKDESEAFWCFVYLLERLGPNFNRDQSGMHSQLFALSKLVELLDSPLHDYFKQNDCLNFFFCFRWILIQFKREFEYETTLRLWEVLWTHYPSEHLHLYVCVAILKRHRAKIMGEQMGFDTLLKFINELSGQIDLDPVLRDAEALCVYAGENGVASIPPGTPPSLSSQDASIYQQQDDEVL
ncbi:putative small G signaling modulator, Rab-binding protein [Helianthus anomalus]